MEKNSGKWDTKNHTEIVCIFSNEGRKQSIRNPLMNNVVWDGEMVRNFYNTGGSPRKIRKSFDDSLRVLSFNHLLGLLTSIRVSKQLRTNKH